MGNCFNTHRSKTYRKMTFEEKALEDRAQHAAKAVNDAAKNLYENAKDKAHDAVETFNEAAKNLNEQWSKITQDTVENCGKDLGDLTVGLGVIVGLTFFVFGICRIVAIVDKVEDMEVDVNVRVEYYDEPQNEEKHFHAT